MADDPTGGGGGDEISSLAKKKVGGIPLWLIIGGVAVIAGFLWYRHKQSTAGNAQPASASGDQVPIAPTSAQLVAAGLYSPPPYEIAGNIAGPQGPQGVAGETGPAGPPGTDPTTLPHPPLAPQPVQMLPTNTPAPAPTPVAAMAPSSPSPPQPRFVVVQPWPQQNSTLSGIAKSVGQSLARIESLNPQISNPNLIYPGQNVRVA